MSGKKGIFSVKKAFNSDKIVKNYTQDVKNIGLWKSEKIIVEQYFNKDDSILDIGCGAGRTTLNLYEMGYEKISGVDLSSRMIERAKELCNELNYDIKFYVNNVMNLPFNDCKFESAMFSYNGLMYIPKQKNRIKSLKEIKRVLKPKGYFWFTAHDRRGINGEYNDIWKKRKETWRNEDDERLYEFGDMIVDMEGKPTFMHFPKRKEVVETIKKSGFKLVEDLPRSKIHNETKKIEENIADCRFYILKK